MVFFHTFATMKHFLAVFFAVLLSAASGKAQSVTAAVTVYKEFRPATVYLFNGNKTKVDMANIFLKNSSLLFMKDGKAMEANMNTISRVEFGDRAYHRIGDFLAYVVDTVGSEALYCAQTIDMEAFQKWVSNNTEISDLSLGDNIGVTTVEIGEETEMPIRESFYFNIKGKYILLTERNLKSKLNKEQRRILSSFTVAKDFSWTSGESLLKLLRALHI